MNDNLSWRKSSLSGTNGGECVEVADHDRTILVRDTKDHRTGPVHTYTTTQWHAFLAAVRAAEHELD